MLVAVSMHHQYTLRWYLGGYCDMQPTASSMSFILAFFKEHGVQDEDMGPVMGRVTP
jgi:hypothetical protein